MTLIKDVTVGDGEEVPPNTRFFKTWKIQNSGQFLSFVIRYILCRLDMDNTTHDLYFAFLGREQWPYGCSLRFLGGAQMTSQDYVAVESLHPGHSCDVNIEMTSPQQPGIYEGQWRMTTSSGLFFGEVIWVIISVAEGGLLGLTQQMNAFHSLGSSPPNNSPTSAGSGSGSGSGSSNQFGFQLRPQPSVTVTSPDFSTVDLTRPSFASQSDMEGMNVEMGESSPIFPVKRSLVDRVKDANHPHDDNQENCIKICKDILTRSSSISCPSTSYDGHGPGGGGLSPVTRRGSIKGCSPLAVTDGLAGVRAMTPSSSSSSSSSSESATPNLISRLHRQGSSPAQVNSLPNNTQSSSIQTGEASSFPPTPPSEDMML